MIQFGDHRNVSTNGFDKTCQMHIGLLINIIFSSAYFIFIAVLCVGRYVADECYMFTQLKKHRMLSNKNIFHDK